MQYKALIQALGVVWLLLFVASFVSLRLMEPDGSLESGLERVVTFLTWQVIAFVVAAAAAFATRVAVARGVERVKAVGYLPLVLSVFLVVSFIAIMGFRFFVAPLFDAPMFE
jgi:hypothetical protein